MGFAVSSMLAFALAGGKDYPVAFTGDGSFMMNPQILIDGVQHGLIAVSYTHLTLPTNIEV